MRSCQALGTPIAISLGLLLATSCSTDASDNGPVRGSQGTSADTDGSGGTSSSSGTSSTAGGGQPITGATTVGIVTPEPTSSSGGDSCLTSCEVVGGTYCGSIGNGCSGFFECGECSGDWVCDDGLCVGGPNCIPTTTCQTDDTQYCGALGDGCGRSIDCGACPGTDVCTGGVCVAPDCVPLTCTSD